MPDPNIFLWIASSDADVAAANSNCIKLLLANDFSTFLIKDYPVFSNGPESLPRNPPECLILCNWVFDNIILAEELLAKALRSFETCALARNNFCGKIFSSLD